MAILTNSTKAVDYKCLRQVVFLQHLAWTRMKGLPKQPPNTSSPWFKQSQAQKEAERAALSPGCKVEKCVTSSAICIDPQII